MFYILISPLPQLPLPIPEKNAMMTILMRFR